MPLDGDQTNTVLAELWYALTKTTTFASASSWSLTNELILEALAGVILVHQLLLEKHTITVMESLLTIFHAVRYIGITNNEDSIKLFWDRRKLFL